VSDLSPTDDHPMIMVTRHDAMAYAEWVGKGLIAVVPLDNGSPLMCGVATPKIAV